MFLIFFLVCEKFANQNQCPDLSNDNKIKAKLLGPITKARKILSASKDAHLLIENFYEDKDLSYVIAREELEEAVN